MNFIFHRLHLTTEQCKNFLAFLCCNSELGRSNYKLSKAASPLVSCACGLLRVPLAPHGPVAPRERTTQRTRHASQRSLHFTAPPRQPVANPGGAARPASAALGAAPPQRQAMKGAARPLHPARGTAPAGPGGQGRLQEARGPGPSPGGAAGGSPRGRSPAAAREGRRGAGGSGPRPAPGTAPPGRPPPGARRGAAPGR